MGDVTQYVKGILVSKDAIKARMFVVSTHEQLLLYKDCWYKRVGPSTSFENRYELVEDEVELLELVIKELDYVERLVNG